MTGNSMLRAMEVQKEVVETEKDEQNFEKDSKLCWWALACGFLTQVLILGVLHAFGVFFVELIKEFSTTKGTTAWVGSIAYGLSMFVGPVTGLTMKRFGHKFAMVLGGFLCSISLCASSFVQGIDQLFFTFSFIYGVGACMSITPTMTLGQDYFDKYLGVSVGIMTSGSSIGTLIMAPTTQTLIDALGWRNTFRVYAGTCLLTSILNLFIRPITNRKKTQSDELRTSPLRRLIAELALWKNRVFIVWTTGITLVMFGYYIPYVHLVSFAVDQGATVEQGSIIIMVFGASTATGRLLFGKIVQLGLLNRLHMHQLSMILSGSATMFLPLISSYDGLLVFIIFFGLVDGCFVVLLPLMTCSLVRTDKVALAWSFLICSSSITFTLGPPVAGFMYDALGSYNLPFHFAGVPVILGALVLFLIPWAQRTSDVKKDLGTIEDVIAFEPDDDVDYITLSRSSLHQGSQITLASMRYSIRNGESVRSHKSVSTKGTPDERYRSPMYYRQREIELPLASSDRNNEFPYMMSGASRKTFDSTGRSYAMSGRDGRGRSIATSSKWGSKKSDAFSVTSDDRRSVTRNSIGIQTDDISITSSSYFLPSSSEIHCQYETKYTSSESAAMSRTSMVENSITSGQIEPFVMEQIERLGETLNSPTRAAELMENPNPQWIRSPQNDVPVPTSRSSTTPTSKQSSPKEILITNPVTFDELLVPAETVSCALSPKNSPIPSVIERKLLYKEELNTPKVSSVVEQPSDIFPIEEIDLTNQTTEHAAHSASPMQEQTTVITPLSTNPYNEQPNFLGNREAFRTKAESTNEVIPVVANTRISPTFSKFGKTLEGTGSIKMPSPTTSVTGPSPPSSLTETESEPSSISFSQEEVNGSPDSQHDPIFKMEHTPPQN